MSWINYERLFTAPQRAENFIVNTPYFSHFLELCVLSYPSPLEEAAPLVSKTILLVITGFFEYIVAAFLADLVDIYIEFLLPWFTTGWPVTPSEQDVNYERILLCLLMLRFATRAKSFFKRPLRNAGVFRLDNLAVSFFWYNPALVYHAAIKALSSIFTSTPFRFGPLYLFWCLMAPSNDIPMAGAASWLRTEEGRQKVKEASKGNLSFKYITYTTITTIFLEKVVTHLPSVTIQVTLFAQGLVHYSASWPNREDGLGEKVSKVLRTIPEPIVRNLELSYLELERFLFELGRVMLCCALASMQMLARLTARLLTTYRTCRQSLPLARPPSSETLGPNERFRLLKLAPASSLEATIVCELQSHNIAQAPKYKAVSYTWGKPSLDHQIILDGMPMKVTRSALEVLKNLRSTYKNQLFWIDAICILQHSASDKAQQLPLMPKIYASASEIIVFLGTSKRAVLATELINRAFLANRLSASSRTRFTYQVPKDAARALKVMLARPWFERAWVVQEVVAARKGVVTVRYGNESLSWQRLSWFTSAISLDPTLLTMLSERVGYSGLDRAVALRNAIVIRRFSLLRSEEVPLSLLFYLIQMFRLNSRFEATVVKDRIYALQGLSGSSIPNLIPDYKKPNQQLYLDVIHNHIATSPTENALDFLPHAGLAYKPPTPSLPTWVPDWSLHPPAQVLLGCEGAPELLASPKLDALINDSAELQSFNQTTPPPGEATPKSIALENTTGIKNGIIPLLPNAMAGTVPSIQLLDGNVLQLRGRRLDVIVAVGMEFPKYSIESWKSALNVLAEWSLLASTYYEPSSSDSSQENIWQLFLQTLIQNRSHAKPLDFTFTTPIARLDPELLAPLTKIPLDQVLNFAAKAMNGTGNGDNEAERAMEAQVAASFQPLLTLIAPICGGWCFAVTRSGRLAVVMPGTEKGDRVVLFDGGRVPFVLRSVKNEEGKGDNTGLNDEESGGLENGLVEGGGEASSDGGEGMYELVGPAYVNGMMHGEALNLDIPIQDIRIR